MKYVYVACWDCPEGIVIENNGTACASNAEAAAFGPERIERRAVSDDDFASVFPGAVGETAPEE